MSYTPKSGCPMCGIVASAVHTPSHSPRSPHFPAGSTAPQVLWRDDNFTIYRERANPVSSKGHLIIVFNLHVPSLYTLSSSDLPLLVTIRDLSRRLLASLSPSTDYSSDYPPASPSSSTTPSHLLPRTVPTDSAQPVDNDAFRIGFITPPFRDSKIPVTDHLHAHAYILPADKMGWWRGVGFSGVAWYSIEDLIAEIREETSNNRIRSGPQPRRGPRPIDLVPSAGARYGTPNGVETTDTGIAVADLEDLDRSPGIRPLTLQSSPWSPDSGPSRSLTGDSARAAYNGSGGALVTGLMGDGRRTPTRSSTSDSGLLSPIKLRT
ncbi:hypothetical protein PHLCEN_2v10980 [Hermanssonia centrifuga]|uniref:HIT domain-containing protein n=1 Tax=Hermanssonia centrifuga TaxID=98765 RepID=A0A2R6NLN9_9APHY|nr:hypothetical protein PHLCEN_2v10980 [Hermanssonia centrifuga]